MESKTINREEYSKETLERIIKKEKDSVEGNKSVITYRGTVITMGSAALLASSHHIIKTVPELSYRLTNQGIAQNILTILGIGTATVIVPLSIALLKYQLPSIKENIRMLKLEKQWLKRDENLLQRKIEQNHQKALTK